MPSLSSFLNLYAAAQDVVLSAVFRVRKRATIPLWQGDPYRMLNMGFREFTFYEVG